MISIRSYDNYVTANMEMNLLKEAGFYCYLQDEMTVTIDPLLSPALGGMKLMVKPEDATLAASLLKNNEDLYVQTIACSHCHKTSLQKVVSRKKFDTLAGRLWSMLKNGQPIEEKTFYRCYRCGQTYNELPLQNTD